MRKAWHTSYRLTYKRGRSGRYKYPFLDMTIGDYIIVPRRLRKRATAAAYMIGRKYGIRFECRKFGTKGRTKIRHIPNERSY